MFELKLIPRLGAVALLLSTCTHAKPAGEKHDTTGWVTAVHKGDVLAFNVDSCATITRATLTLYIRKS